ncbi:hemolysin XhlA family protein [Thermaerobacillus caldiproteolyticus]|uniref:Septal ring factor EnvC (AmiA/AmiB activator) n=1 Tax=Thermaerobacillus caldiproteolyticus TaxID=247480 RepID=A0A7V9Z593_9BACL|nr:hemolysin XhlA family protein [Anoxybacillus caldiproteolyticus]MBA2874295.1 septal ring factor EnvC (AmiA/AmiB activator) [Anoxybacillus caldiproteolyticus]
MEQRVAKLESDVTMLRDDMIDVKTRLAVAEANIKDMRDDIRAIKDDTKWLRRTITNAIIVSVVGGIVAIVFAALKGGV